MTDRFLEPRRLRSRTRAPLVAAALALSACHPPVPRTVADRPGPGAELLTLRVARRDGCCDGAERGRLAQAAEQALARAPGVRLLVAPRPARSPAQHDGVLEARTTELRASLRRVQDLYLRMQMETVRSELGRALATVKQLSGAYLRPEEIATFHLYRAAVSEATGQTAEARQHAEAAVRFFPGLRPDPDVFTPPVRDQVERASRAVRTVEVKVRSEPAGALVLWDGAPRGETPAVLPGQAVGEHYLRLQRAGSQAWHDTIVLSSAAAQLEVRLPSVGPAPAPPPTSLVAADVVELDADGPGLRLVLQTRAGAGRVAHLGAGSSPVSIERAVQKLLGGQGDAGLQRARGGDGAPRPRSHWQRYWWAYALAGAGVVGLGVSIPLGVHAHQPDGRSVKLQLP